MSIFIWLLVIPISFWGEVSAHLFTLIIMRYWNFCEYFTDLDINPLSDVLCANISPIISVSF